MSPMRMRRVAAAVLAFAGVFISRPTAAQEVGRRCQNIELENRSDATRWTFIQQPGGGSIAYAGGGPIFLCRAEGIRLV